MSERENKRLRRLEIKQGKRVLRNSPPQLEKHARMRWIDPYNINHELGSPIEQSERQSSDRPNQRLMIGSNARNQFNGRHDDMPTLSSTDG